jgi:tetraacyldisaccharide 4'-kinase
VDDRGLTERVWYGTDAFASTLRTALIPAERIFGGLVGARELLYDAGWLPARETSIPALSVGNLTVGGTGKTPMAAWLARGLFARGARPAVVLRGYGDDEPLVHRILNPDVPVIVGADRVTAVAQAAAAGATVAVLDDAFQHRRVQRLADIVLVSADRWTGGVRLLPAGPWREPLEAIRRATLVVVTRKAASDLRVGEVHEELARIAPSIPRVSVRLAFGELVRVGESVETRAIESLRGARVRALLSIADPKAFIQQMQAKGIQIDPRIFPDHHSFTGAEIDAALRGVASDDLVLCTLKDAVKLGPLWPRLAPPLWYVSQQVMVERGVGGLERVLDDVVRVRSGTSRTAG